MMSLLDDFRGSDLMPIKPLRMTCLGSPFNWTLGAGFRDGLCGRCVAARVY